MSEAIGEVGASGARDAARPAGADAAAPPVAVRVMTPDDAPLLAEIGARLFRQTYSPHYRPEDVDDYVAGAFGAELQRAELAEPTGCAFLATGPEGAAIGYAQLREAIPRAAEPGAIGPRALELSRIYVDRAWHGRGAAGALMRACVAEGERRGADTLWLAVWRENARAIAFYEKSGFVRAGTQPFQFGSLTESDYVMARPLGATAARAGR